MASNSSFKLSKNDAGAMVGGMGAALQNGVAPTVGTEERFSRGVDEMEVAEGVLTPVRLVRLRCAMGVVRVVEAERATAAPASAARASRRWSPEAEGPTFPRGLKGEEVGE